MGRLDGRWRGKGLTQVTVVVVPRVVAACAAAPGGVPTTRRVAGTGLALLAVLAAGGCGAATGPQGPDADPVGVIEGIYQEMRAGSSLEQAQAVAMQAQERISACMAEQGFEYTPVTPQIQDGQKLQDALVAELGAVPGTLEFAEQHGYGWTTGAWQGQAYPDQPEPDPNIQRQVAMDESEALAYSAALYGADPTDDWQTQGCEGRVGHEVTSEQNVTAVTDPALQVELDTMWATIGEHPRQVELDSYWAQCRAESGNPGFTVPLDAENSILEAQAALNPDDADAVADLTAREIALAVADYTCREDVSYADTQRQISIDVQQEFYDAHQTEVDGWLQAVQEARG